MTTTDTLMELVSDYAQLVASHDVSGSGKKRNALRAAISALVAERDAAKYEAETLRLARDYVTNEVAKIIAERNALKADAERWQWLLRKAYRDASGRMALSELWNKDDGLSDAEALTAIADAARGEKTP